MAQLMPSRADSQAEAEPIWEFIEMPELDEAAQAAPEKIPSLTPVRGIAALLVVAFHLRFYIPNLQYEVVFPAFHMGYLWVDFFFILSGFILSHVYGRQLQRGLGKIRYASFLYLRWCRIYPLHFAVLLGFVIFEFVQIALHSGFGLLPAFQAFSGSHSIPGIFSHLLLINTLNVHDILLWNFPAWSISAEFVAYIAFPVLFVVFRRLAPLQSWLAFSILLYLLNLLALSNGGRLALHHDYGAVRCLLEFSVGIFVYRAYVSGRFVALMQRDSSFALIACWILFAMTTFARDILIVTAFAALVLLTARNTGRISRVLASRPLIHLGEISYSIYMVNILLFQILEAAWTLLHGGKFGSDFSLAESWIAWLVAMGLVVAVANWSYRAIECRARIYFRRRDPFAGRARAQALKPLDSLAHQ
jgi:peptidoglycan/LPS O-acetylase OafA/YrhL